MQKFGTIDLSVAIGIPVLEELRYLLGVSRELLAECVHRARCGEHAGELIERESVRPVLVPAPKELIDDGRIHAEPERPHGRVKFVQRNEAITVVVPRAKQFEHGDRVLRERQLELLRH